MATAASEKLAELYLRDETAWLEANSNLIRAGRLDEVDHPNLAEYLKDMANRDRRAVKKRLSILMAHLLKWQFQPERRSRSWHTTILVQRADLLDRTESGVLRLHAAEVLPKAYADAVRFAVAETGLPESTFPADCPYSLDDVLTGPIDSGTA
jgi:hypothetical protein